MSKSFVGVLGIVLIIVGAISLIWGGITYTQRDEVVDLGGLEIDVETKERLPLPPILGGIALVGGIVLVVVSRKRS